ncbi:MAG: hypothetical protein M3Z66_08000 [Chloroflexota bacterium]|nr:hypothetical protein [Chloroflexota bacterium]
MSALDADECVRRRPSQPNGSAMQGAHRWLVAFALMVTLGSVSPLLVQADPAVTDLGKPVELYGDPYFPLSGFHKVTFMPFRPRHPTLLVLASQPSVSSAVERWPLVKALGWFGTLTNVKSTTFASGIATFDRFHVATFDLSHARYRSRYLTLLYRDLLDVHSRVLHKMSKVEFQLYTKYVRPFTSSTQQQDPYALIAASDPAASTERELPLLVFGRYISTGSQQMISGVFQGVPPPDTPGIMGAKEGAPYSFRQIQDALIRGKSLGPYTGPGLVQHVNGEANILGALICHGDGGQPKSVCDRTSIRASERHIK